MTTKQYLRFEPSTVFGVIASSTARILNVDQTNKYNYVAVPACEDVILWNLQTKEKILKFHGELSYVTCLNYDVNYNYLAIGYADGFIRIFDVKSGDNIVSFCGHKSAVSCLTYDSGHLNLASGGKDSEIVVWNVTDQAGLFRLKGHKGPITRCQFLKERNILISSSKDTFLKLWDLDTQHCFQTIVGNRYEILDFVTIKDTRLIVAANDHNLKVWDLFINEDALVECVKKVKLDISEDKDKLQENTVEKNAQIVEEEDDKFKCVKVGEIHTTERPISLVTDKTERIFGCNSSSKKLQLYKILNSEETLKHFRKRKRKEEGKRSEHNDELSATCEITPELCDQFVALAPIQTSGKIDSFSITMTNESVAKVSVLLKNNSICQYELNIISNIAELCHNIVLPGHRSVIQCLNYSADSLAVMSLSNEAVKIWRRYQGEQICTQTLSCNAGLCSAFISGSTHCVVGTKNGTLEIFDVNSQELLERIESHESAVNCLCESPNQCGVTSGSKDKCIKFWNFELLSDENYSKSKKKLSLSLKRTLQMPDEVLCVRYSPDKSKIAVSLLDNTVQVLFVDTLKLVFSLYGHVLPVTCFDISYDSTLIVTGSEDKDIRVWSMEFGSCNKFIKKAHDGGITALHFLPKTHLFFSGGRDCVLKQWDADNFQKIITLKGHQNEVSAMAVSPDGVTVVTASKDKSVRIWEKTQEPLVLEEEKDKELEEENETGDLPVVPGEVNKEVALPGIKTVETIKSVEQLIEAIDVYKQEIVKLQDHEIECKNAGKVLPPPTPHPLLLAYSASSPIRYIQKVVKRIKSSELEGTLLYLPFSYVLDFLKILCEFVDRGWETEFCERCSSFLVRIHMGQMLAAENFYPVIKRLKETLFSRVYEATSRIGVVKTVCQLQQKAIDDIEDIPMFTNILDGLQQKKKRSKKKIQRSIVAFS